MSKPRRTYPDTRAPALVTRPRAPAVDGRAAVGRTRQRRAGRRRGPTRARAPGLRQRRPGVGGRGAGDAGAPAGTPPYASLAPLARLTFPAADLYPPTHWAIVGTPPAFDTPDEDVYLTGRNVMLLSKAGIHCAQKRHRPHRDRPAGRQSVSGRDARVLRLDEPDALARPRPRRSAIDAPFSGHAQERRRASRAGAGRAVGADAVVHEPRQRGGTAASAASAASGATRSSRSVRRPHGVRDASRCADESDTGRSAGSHCRSAAIRARSQRTLVRSEYTSWPPIDRVADVEIADPAPPDPPRPLRR